MKRSKNVYICFSGVVKLYVTNNTCSQFNGLLTPFKPSVAVSNMCWWQNQIWKQCRQMEVCGTQQCYTATPFLCLYGRYLVVLWWTIQGGSYTVTLWAQWNLTSIIKWAPHVLVVHVLTGIQWTATVNGVPPLVSGSHTRLKVFIWGSLIHHLASGIYSIIINLLQASTLIITNCSN